MRKISQERKLDMKDNNIEVQKYRNTEAAEKMVQQVKETHAPIDTDGVCWTDREFSHPERTIRVATSFSGIGAPEQALKRLGLKVKHVFACDIGERYLKYRYPRLKKFTEDLNEEDKKLFARYLYEGNKSQCKGTGFTEKSVYNNLYVNEVPSKIELELVKECIDLITKGMTPKDKITYINSLYDEVGVNYVKESFMANYDLKEEDWHNDIRFFDATPYRGEVDLYIGGSPCTSFSLSGKRLTLEDTRGTLFYDFAKRIEECRPKVFIFENVKTMMSVSKKKEKYIKDKDAEEYKSDGDKVEVSGLAAAVSAFKDLGYTIFWHVLDGKDYGIPQHRERIWLIGFREPTDFKFPKPITLTTRTFDYLDKDKAPGDGKFVEVPYNRYLTGMECLRLMGFPDFKVADKIKCLPGEEQEEKLQQQAGNSMVVECLMAIFKQLDITQYGVDLINLGDLSIQELSDLIMRASTILNKKLSCVNAETVCNEITPVADGDNTIEVQEDVPSHTEDMESDELTLLEPLVNADDTEKEYIDVKPLPPFDFSGRPTSDIQKIGNVNEAKESAPDPQWGRVYSVNGVCPTITHTKPPMILVSNEVETCPPEVIEVEIPVRKPNPLW